MSETKAIKAGYGRYTPPQDPLKEIFGTVMPVDLMECPTASDQLRFRLEVLAASGPDPSDKYDAERLRVRKAQKAAWETYLHTAFACGMFEGTKGDDLRARLTSIDDANFRSAMSECEACWLLAGLMKLPVDPYAQGRGHKNLEMRIMLPEGDINVEVKAPFRELPHPPPGKHVFTWEGDDSDKVAQCLVAANKQFGDGTPNILVVVPILRTRMFSNRDDLIRAAYGQTKVTFQVNPRARSFGAAESRFFPEGKFLETMKPGGRPLKPDGLPAHRRISAILCIEEKLVERYPHPDPLFLIDEEIRDAIWPAWKEARDLHFSKDNTVWIEHDVLVLHNPHAYHTVSQEMWAEFPQFVPVGDRMEWTDGYEVRV